MSGYPSDDRNRLNQIAFGDDSLDIYYNYQFVQHEKTNDSDGSTPLSKYHPLEHTPVCPGTMTGTVYRKGLAIQTFVVATPGTFTFQDIGTPKVKAVGGAVNWAAGEIELLWNETPGENYAVISYEYNPEYTPENDWSKPKTGGMLRCTFDKFFDHSEIEKFAREAATVCCWDFNTALGDTIREKYESLYVKIVELTAVMIKKGAKGYFWICCSPELSSVLTTATLSFRPNYDNSGLSEHIPMGIVAPITQEGILDRKWRIFVDSNMDCNMILIGCNDTRQEPECYGRMLIANFIV